MQRNLKEKYKSIITFLTSVGFLCIVLICSNFFYGKFDLTADKRYTLTPETIQLLEDLDDVVQLKIYLTGDELPAGFVKLKNSLDELLNEFSNHTAETIEFEFINLQDIASKTKREKEIARLAQLGIPYLPLKQQHENSSTSFYVTPGVEVFYKGKTVGVSLLEVDHQNFDSNFKAAIENLEYQLSNAIRKLAREHAQNIGFLQTHGESDQLELQDLLKTLSEYYVTGPVVIQDHNGIDLNALSLIDVLVVSGPKTAFNEGELFVIDQFIMNGGKALFLLDGIHAELDSLRYAPYFPAMPYNSGIEKLLFNYGIRINNDIVEDQQCTQIPIQTGPAGSNGKAELYPWVYFPLLYSDNNHKINRNLDPVKVEFASTLDSVQGVNKTYYTLLQTSDRSRYVATPTRIGFEDAVAGINDQKLNQKSKSIAMLSEGQFTSYFNNRILPEGFSSKKKLVQENNSAKIIVVGSGTFANNIILSNEKALPLGADRYDPSLFYDNKRFLLNCINYLSGDEDLIAVRSKRIELRLLDKNKVKNEQFFIKTLNIALPPTLILLLAAVFYFVRRKKFAI